MKALIVAGDRALIAEILTAMCAIDTNCAESMPDIIKKRKKNKMLGEGAILLDELDPSAPLTDAESTLEFLILSCCQAFSLSPKLAAGLLSQSGKILSQVLIKGLKGNIDPVIN